MQGGRTYGKGRNRGGELGGEGKKERKKRGRNDIKTSHKKVFRMKTSTCRDETLKNQLNKMGTTPQHIHTIPTSCAILPTMFCVC